MSLTFKSCDVVVMTELWPGRWLIKTSLLPQTQDGLRCSLCLSPPSKIWNGGYCRPTFQGCCHDTIVHMNQFLCIEQSSPFSSMFMVDLLCFLQGYSGRRYAAAEHPEFQVILQKCKEALSFCCTQQWASAFQGEPNRTGLNCIASDQTSMFGFGLGSNQPFVIIQ